MWRKLRLSRFIDLPFLAGAALVLVVMGAAFEGGRAIFLAAELKASVLEAGHEAIATYAERRDPQETEEATRTAFRSDLNGLGVAALSEVVVNETKGTLRVVGSAPLSFPGLGYVGIQGIVLNHTLEAPLPPARIAQQ